MRIADQAYAEVPLSDLRVHPRNYNQGDVGAIYESIEHNGFYGAVIAQRGTGHILAGNHRYLAARHHQAATIPVLWLDVDDAAALKILLADNRLAALATPDEGKIAELLSELAGTAGLEGTGYDGDDLDDLIAKLAPEGPKEPKPEKPLPSQFAVYVDCETEERQVELLERLGEEGYECRALTS